MKKNLPSNPKTHWLTLTIIFLSILGLGILSSSTATSKKEKKNYHKELSRFIPSDFAYVENYFQYLQYDGGTYLEETYKAKDTPEAALAKVIAILRKEKVELYKRHPDPPHELGNNGTLSLSADYLDKNKKKNDITITIHDVPVKKTPPQEVEITFSISNWFTDDENIPLCGLRCETWTIPSAVLLDTTGFGNKTTQEFTSTNYWDLYWNYDCSESKEGAFTVTAHGNYVYDTKNETLNLVLVDQFGIKDHGIEPIISRYTKGTFYFEVETTCSWSLQVKGTR